MQKTPFWCEELLWSYAYYIEHMYANQHQNNVLSEGNLSFSHFLSNIFSLRFCYESTLSEKYFMHKFFYVWVSLILRFQDRLIFKISRGISDCVRGRSPSTFPLCGSDRRTFLLFLFSSILKAWWNQAQLEEWNSSNLGDWGASPTSGKRRIPNIAAYWCALSSAVDRFSRWLNCTSKNLLT